MFKGFEKSRLCYCNTPQLKGMLYPLSPVLDIWPHRKSPLTQQLQQHTVTISSSLWVQSLEVASAGACSGRAVSHLET